MPLRIVAGLVLGSICLWSFAAEPASRKPNIVYLLADQWRASATGYAGDPNVRTPNLDRLARQGLNFRNAVSVCPVCTPYRAALMTGRFPTTTGMFLNDAYLPAEEVCMAEVFGQSGYSTAYIGKWHLDGHGRGSYIPPERRQGWQYWKGAECDHNYNHSHYYTDASDTKRFWEGYDAFAQTRDARQFLRDHARDERPFLLMVAYGVPHFPHQTAPAEYKALYPPEKIALPPNVPQSQQAKARQEAQGYYAHCTALDQCVGDIMAALAETGLEESTILVFTSDHGEMLGSHDCPPLMKHVAWNESALVPLLVRYPAMHGKQGRVVQTPITTPDLLPTLLGLIGQPPPRTVEGTNLSDSIRGGRDLPDRPALFMGVAPFIPQPYGKEYRAIRTARWTYVRGLDGPWMLFDNARDPNQMENLVDKPDRAAVVKDLDARLWAELKRTGDEFHPGAWYIDEFGYRIAKHGSIAYDEPNARPQSPRRRTP